MPGIDRRKTRTVFMGKTPIGGDSPIAVQSMTNTDTRDAFATLDQVRQLASAGCEIVRVAVPDEDAVAALREISAHSPVPIVADIHFDHRLAIAAAETGVAGLRINPGNIGGQAKVAEVIAAAKANGLCVRIGVNAGSLEKKLVDRHGGPTPLAMAESALIHADFVGAMGFDNFKVSLKASDILKTIEAHRIFARKSDAPLHVGITEAGTMFSGAVKSAVGLGILFFEGLGDTVRVSLAGDPLPEVRTAYTILKALGLRRRGPDIIACPTCGRTEMDASGLAERVEQAVSGFRAPLSIAVMGCVVNGPGEAREADVGVAGGRGTGILFRKGKVLKKFAESELFDRLMAEIRAMEEDYLERNA
ncbi:MAG: flavodoxin-dependent (E)-4-hydroxy-3-methylbut-2-enyl-diphosphate synthase [Deltaproteobacteria bacterium]|nr:flavodoxin-dependent (E)-4-hydroxy-3-methylbut-2-enyl-diphosphate synthase [Deltaproteobacteria bacterium]